MEKFVKIKSPFKVVDVKFITIKGASYMECLVEKDNCTSIVAVATKTATKQLVDELAKADVITEVNIRSKDNESYYVGNLGLVAWLTVNKYGHTISYVRKESLCLQKSYLL